MTRSADEKWTELNSAPWFIGMTLDEIESDIAGFLRLKNYRVDRILLSKEEHSTYIGEQFSFCLRVSDRRFTGILDIALSASVPYYWLVHRHDRRPDGSYDWSKEFDPLVTIHPLSYLEKDILALAKHLSFKSRAVLQGRLDNLLNDFREIAYDQWILLAPSIEHGWPVLIGPGNEKIYSPRFRMLSRVLTAKDMSNARAKLRRFLRESEIYPPKGTLEEMAIKFGATQTAFRNHLWNDLTTEFPRLSKRGPRTRKSPGINLDPQS